MREVLLFCAASGRGTPLRGRHGQGVVCCAEDELRHGVFRRVDAELGGITVSLVPECPKALPDALRAISEADLILLGPGSLYTSVIPNLLVDGVADAIRASHAQKFYICNIMTQDGETEGYTAADHLEALQRHGREGIVDLCLANNAPIPRGLAARYSEEDAELLRVDRERIAALGIALAEYPLLSAQGGYARHDPALLAQAVMELYRERTVRIYRGTQQYITEEQEWK